MAARGRISDREHTRSHSLNIENKQKQITERGGRFRGRVGRREITGIVQNAPTEVFYGLLSGLPRNTGEKLNTGRHELYRKREIRASCAYLMIPSPFSGLSINRATNLSYNIRCRSDNMRCINYTLPACKKSEGKWRDTCDRYQRRNSIYWATWHTAILPLFSVRWW